MMPTRRDFTRGLLIGGFAPSLCATDRRTETSPIHLEIIASSTTDALAALEGGATRLELAVHLDQGGLTPPLDLVREIQNRVTLPVRVMLRESSASELSGAQELKTLKSKAQALARLNVEGIIVGFTKKARLDLEALQQIITAAPSLRFTIHNAVEMTADPLEALRALRNLSNVDRVLVSGGKRSLAERIERLTAYRQAWESSRHIVAGNLRLEMLAPIRRATGIREFHLGEAVRTPEESYPRGQVDVQKVRRARENLLAKG